MILLWFLYSIFPGSCSVILWILCIFVLVVKKIRLKVNSSLLLTTVLNLIAYACVLTQFQPIFSFIFHFLSLCHTHVHIHIHTHTHMHSVICICISLLPQILFFGVVKIHTSTFVILTIYKNTIQWH